MHFNMQQVLSRGRRTIIFATGLLGFRQRRLGLRPTPDGT